MFVLNQIDSVHKLGRNLIRISFDPLKSPLLPITIIYTAPMHYRQQGSANIAIGITLNSGLQFGSQSLKLGLVLSKVFSARGVFRYCIRQTNRRPFTVYRTGPPPRFSFGRNGIRMLTVPFPLMSQESAKFVYLLVVTSQRVSPVAHTGLV